MERKQEWIFDNYHPIEKESDHGIWYMDEITDNVLFYKSKKENNEFGNYYFLNTEMLDSEKVYEFLDTFDRDSEEILNSKDFFEMDVMKNSDFIKCFLDIFPDLVFKEIKFQPGWDDVNFILNIK